MYLVLAGAQNMTAFVQGEASDERCFDKKRLIFPLFVFGSIRPQRSSSVA